MGLTQNFSGFLAVRFFLGVAESGLFPGTVFYFSMWYKRSEQHIRVALFFSAASLAGAFGGILAFGIAKMRNVGGYKGWRWIFIIEGLLTVVISIAAYFLVHNYPKTATFLTEDEKALVIKRLENDSDAIRDEPFTWAGVINSLKDPKVFLYGLGFHTMSLPLYTLSLFLVSSSSNLIQTILIYLQPTIIKSLGYTNAQAQLMTIRKCFVLSMMI
jgi:MFS family permease